MLLRLAILLPIAVVSSLILLGRNPRALGSIELRAAGAQIKQRARGMLVERRMRRDRKARRPFMIDDTPLRPARQRKTRRASLRSGSGQPNFEFFEKIAVFDFLRRDPKNLPGSVLFNGQNSFHDVEQEQDCCRTGSGKAVISSECHRHCIISCVCKGSKGRSGRDGHSVVELARPCPSRGAHQVDARPREGERGAPAADRPDDGDYQFQQGYPEEHQSFFRGDSKQRPCHFFSMMKERAGFLSKTILLSLLCCIRVHTSMMVSC